MRIARIPEIAKLSVPEKILLIEDLWDSIREDAAKVPVRADHVAELKRRAARTRRRPSELLTLDEFRKRVAAKK